MRFLNKAKTDVMTDVCREGVQTPVGSFAREVAKIGTVGTLSSVLMVDWGIVNMVAGVHDPLIETVVSQNYTRKASGDIKITNQTVTEVLTTQPIDPTVLADRVATQLEAARTLAVTHINGAAEQTRLQYITPGSAMSMVYGKKETEAKAFQSVIDAVGTPDAVDYPFMSARSASQSMTMQAVADEWNAAAAQWITIAAHIETVREKAVVAVSDPAIDQTGIQNVMAALDFTPPA